jgi:hypothetical protein
MVPCEKVAPSVLKSKTKIVTCTYRALRGGLRLWWFRFEQFALAHLALTLLLPRQDALQPVPHLQAQDFVL